MLSETIEYAAKRVAEDTELDMNGVGNVLLLLWITSSDLSKNQVVSTAKKYGTVLSNPIAREHFSSCDISDRGQAVPRKKFGQDELEENKK